MTIKSYKDLQTADLEAMARAAEADAGQAIPGLRESLADLQAGKFGAVHTPEQIAKRKAGRPRGSVKADAKVSTTLRLDPEVLAAFKATGAGWQTRVNDLLLADIQAGRHVKA
ncbi:BrnA antitoxin family protein [Acidovorax sp. Root217]|uniref:BrnA antitoxin family protein n=1 Tax=Acidovorax sp. Root217 TaxID=1736492 RepID=UPI000B066A86|nr:BrnA antitoxin family protein [Acidovorax sp. Root217]